MSTGHEVTGGHLEACPVPGSGGEHTTEFPDEVCKLCGSRSLPEDPSKTDPCPPGWQPTCCCSSTRTEPDDNCPIHGFPDTRKCLWCGKFMALTCGCGYRRSPMILRHSDFYALDTETNESVRVCQQDGSTIIHSVASILHVPDDEATEAVVPGSPQHGQVYRHFKGTSYTVYGIGWDARHNRWAVIYTGVDERVWVRSHREFTDTVERKGYKGPRFTKES